MSRMLDISGTNGVRLLALTDLPSRGNPLSLADWLHEYDRIARARSAPSVRFAREVLWEAGEGHLRQSFRLGRLLASLILDTDERKTRVGDFLTQRGAT